MRAARSMRDGAPVGFFAARFCAPLAPRTPVKRKYRVTMPGSGWLVALVDATSPTEAVALAREANPVLRDSPVQFRASEVV